MSGTPAEGYRPVEILLVEDDSIDAEAITRAFRKAKVANPIVLAKDGQEALEILRGEGETSIGRPFLVILDLNMPRMNGLEFLHELRTDEALRSSIVFVLTTSDDDADKCAAYAEVIAGYMVKSRAGKDFVNLIELLDHYWRVVEFPPEVA